MANYTDEQIKAAFFPETDREKELFDRINRQEAEIERLKEKNRLACQCTPKAIRRAKSEAIKEFAERLKEKMFCEDFLLCEPCDMADIIDNLVKEMVGEGDVYQV